MSQSTERSNKTAGPQSDSGARAARDAIVERARELAPLLAVNAAESNRLRHLHPRNIEIMRESGVFRVTQPQRIGGYEMDLRTVYRVTYELSRACPSSGWVYMVFAAHTWILGMFPETVQDEIAADDPHTLVSGTLAPQGQAEPVDGGVRLSGRWQFCSGVDHAKWSLIGAAVANAQAGAPRAIHVMMPQEDYEADDTWHVLGMRGTGSKDLVLDNAFVPQRRIMPTGPLFGGTGEPARRHPSHLYQLPVMPGLSLHIAGVVMALAHNALDRFTERTRVREDVYSGSQKAHNVAAQMRLSEATAEVKAAELLLLDCFDLLDGLTAARGHADVPLRARLKLQASYAMQLVRRAVERLFAASGAHATFDDAPMQAIFRDINVAVHHAAIDFDSIAETHGRIALGLPHESTVL